MNMTIASNTVHQTRLSLSSASQTVIGERKLGQTAAMPLTKVLQHNLLKGSSTEVSQQSIRQSYWQLKQVLASIWSLEDLSTAIMKHMLHARIARSFLYVEVLWRTMLPVLCSLLLPHMQ
jgi:hypothetical protein